ncbi:MAG: hypothetical protein KF774_18125 [Planctomyces sp.]|nr:hypothetical protein [Planctomyces sp.]
MGPDRRGSRNALRRAAAWWLSALIVVGSARGSDIPEVQPLTPAAVAGLKDADDGLWESQLEEFTARLQKLEQGDRKRADEARAKADKDKLTPTIKWTGQLQADHYWFDQDSESVATYGDIQDGSAFRRARFGMFGEYGLSEYRIEVDFALSGRPSFLDVWAGLHELPGIGRVRIGHFFEPYSLERLTPNRFLTFMERALPDQPFAPARNLGASVNNTWDDDHGTWAVGFFRSDSDVFGDDVGDGFESAVTGRLTWLPWYDESRGLDLLHLGAAYSIRGTSNGVARFRAQPEARIGAATPNVPFFVDTGNIPADWFQLIGLEAAWVRGPFSLQGEYNFVPVDADAGSLLFTGWYVQTTLFLTGEHRPYRRDLALFDRVKPHTEFVRRADDGERICVGPGAWEIAARLSQLDLNDGPVAGGKITDFTVGLNWHMSKYMRVTANYVLASSVPAGSDRTRTNIFATRFGYEF